MSAILVLIEDILTSWRSVDEDCYCDGRPDHFVGCDGCQDVGCCCDCPPVEQDGDCGWCNPERRRQAWEVLLQRKRCDPQYEDVVLSLREYGFIRPLTMRRYGGEVQHGDGHHRLAAAIELGYWAIPYEDVAQDNSLRLIMHDSGEWEYGCDVPTTNRREEQVA